eukprot:112137-Prymnesium_polylepis.1
MSRVPRCATPPMFVLTPSLSEASVARTVEIGEVGVRAATALRISKYVGVDEANGNCGYAAITRVVGGAAGAGAGAGADASEGGGGGFAARVASQAWKSATCSGGRSAAARGGGALAGAG